MACWSSPVKGSARVTKARRAKRPDSEATTRPIAPRTAVSLQVGRPRTKTSTEARPDPRGPTARTPSTRSCRRDRRLEAELVGACVRTCRSEQLVMFVERDDPAAGMSYNAVETRRCDNACPSPIASTAGRITQQSLNARWGAPTFGHWERAGSEVVVQDYLPHTWATARARQRSLVRNQ
jgi:hypothetical protein